MALYRYIARIDEDGYVFIVDRKKDMIISCGYNIYPREIDEVLYEHPKVLDAVAIGVPDLYRGEMVKAYVVLRPGESATEEEIIQFTKTRLAPIRCPGRLNFANRCPRAWWQGVPQGTAQECCVIPRRRA